MGYAPSNPILVNLQDWQVVLDWCCLCSLLIGWNTTVLFHWTEWHEMRLPYPVLYTMNGLLQCSSGLYSAIWYASKCQVCTMLYSTLGTLLYSNSQVCTALYGMLANVSSVQCCTAEWCRHSHSHSNSTVMALDRGEPSCNVVIPWQPCTVLYRG